MPTPAIPLTITLEPELYDRLVAYTAGRYFGNLDIQEGAALLIRETLRIAMKKVEDSLRAKIARLPKPARLATKKPAPPKRKKHPARRTGMLVQRSKKTPPPPPAPIPKSKRPYNRLDPKQLETACAEVLKIVAAYPEGIKGDAIKELGPMMPDENYDRAIGKLKRDGKIRVERRGRRARFFPVALPSSPAQRGLPLKPSPNGQDDDPEEDLDDDPEEDLDKDEADEELDEPARK